MMAGIDGRLTRLEDSLGLDDGATCSCPPVFIVRYSRDDVPVNWPEFVPGTCEACGKPLAPPRRIVVIYTKTELSPGGAAPQAPTADG